MGFFFNFNGTAGVWRIKAINDAGGWESDTVVEDMDLSLRVYLKVRRAPAPPRRPGRARARVGGPPGAAGEAPVGGGDHTGSCTELLCRPDAVCRRRGAPAQSCAAALSHVQGWRSLYLHDVKCPNELPSTLSAYKTQQFRWLSGPMQIVRKSFSNIFFSKCARGAGAGGRAGERAGCMRVLGGGARARRRGTGCFPEWWGRHWGVVGERA